MATKLTDKQTLAYLGEKAEYQFVKTLIENPGTFTQICTILNENIFTVEPLKDIVKILKSFYNEKGFTAKYKDVEIILKAKAKTDIESIKYRDTFSKLKDEDLLIGSETTKDECISRIKTLEMERVLKNGLNTVKENGYSEERVNHIYEGLQGLNKGSFDNSVTPAELFDVILGETEAERVPTGIKELDAQLNGGVPRGGLGILIAGTGVGKTTLSSIMCCGAALRGYNVLHIFFEDTVSEVGKKYYASITGRYTNEFDAKGDREVLKNELFSDPNVKETLCKRVKLWRMDNGNTTVEDIINKIRHMVSNEGWKPDMVFVDYMSCLKTSSSTQLSVTNECQMLERAMKRLESFAQDEKIVVWTAQQTNRDGQKAATYKDRLANIQGSFRMTQPCGFALYLDRTGIEEGCYDRANLYLDKCRGCRRAEWENILLDNGNCQIDLSMTSEELVDAYTYKDEDYE